MRETHWMLLCIDVSLRAPPKNEVVGIAGIYKQRVVSDSQAYFLTRIAMTS